MNDPLKLQVKITAALMLLLAATVAFAYVDLGAFNTPVAMAVALAKAAMIVAVFMRMRESSGLMRLALFAGIFWLGILFALGLSDFLTRTTS